MASNNRQKAQHERKQDRAHISHGEQRAHAAAEQRRRQAQAAAERVEAANAALRAQRRDAPDPLDTSYQIDLLGTVGGEAGAEGAGVPFSQVERNYTETTPETNAALARGVRGSIQSHAKSLLIGADGAPKVRDNFLQRIDPTYRITEENYQWALRRFAQRARTGVKWERRWITFRLYGEKVSVKQIGLQLGLGEAHVWNYLRDARHYMQGLMEGRQDEAC